MTTLGLIVIPLTVYAIFRPAFLPYLMAATMPLVSSSALEFSGNKVQPFFVAAIAPALLLGLRRSKPSNLGLLPVTLVAFFAATAVALPAVFRGIPVLVARGGVDEQVEAPGQLEFTISNLAQAGYFGLAVLVVVYFARNPPKNSRFIAAGFAVGTLLNLWALANQLIGIFYPREVFRTSLFGIHSDSYFNGAQRFSGIYSEPSMLATFSVAAGVYGLFALGTKTHRNAVGVFLLASNLTMLAMSYSGTAVAGGGLVAGLTVGVVVWRFVSGQSRVRAEVMLLMIVAAVVIATASAVVHDYAAALIEDKLRSSSYANRSGSNAFSWDLFLDTWYLGAGLGSSRPSSFAMLLLSNVGLVGTGLYVALVGRIALRARSIAEMRPELWALIGVLLVKVVAEPNLSNPIPWMLLAACAAAYSSGVDSEPRPSNTSTRTTAATGGRAAHHSSLPGT
ncbi:hypothetical protein [Aeromicrobium chenweiae]|uniref:Uncharacterized protein n=1 Tax=Aeromicrobium chenweiae TaxID=2079793 RepID=A0A2S0WI11_9ACTN|nr:hypothetical protein [Aeromicrobium chenweiae]AWB90870.1 hypothetical protein C3E78_00720 [Aeromicrobium chenweiae]TGN32090.1 hypothetical protein E4L97_10240 [Aeromicrobium chenweiae]